MGKCYFGYVEQKGRKGKEGSCAMINYNYKAMLCCFVCLGKCYFVYVEQKGRKGKEGSCVLINYNYKSFS